MLVTNSSDSAVLSFLLILGNYGFVPVSAHVCWTYMQILMASSLQCELGFWSLRVSDPCKLLEKKTFIYPPVQGHHSAQVWPVSQQVDFIIFGGKRIFFKVIMPGWPLLVHLASFPAVIWKSLHCLQTSIMSGAKSDVYLVGFPLMTMHLSFLAVLTIIFLFALLFFLPSSFACSLLSFSPLSLLSFFKSMACFVWM